MSLFPLNNPHTTINTQCEGGRSNTHHHPFNEFLRKIQHLSRSNIVVSLANCSILSSVILDMSFDLWSCQHYAISLGPRVAASRPYSFHSPVFQPRAGPLLRFSFISICWCCIIADCVPTIICCLCCCRRELSTLLLYRRRQWCGYCIGGSFPFIAPLSSLICRCCPSFPPLLFLSCCRDSALPSPALWSMGD